MDESLSSLSGMEEEKGGLEGGFVFESGFVLSSRKKKTWCKNVGANFVLFLFFLGGGGSFFKAAYLF